ncbi:GNAT family N-acetyltransferase [Thalassospira lucentensis]|uniref:GNAT family N-acetyltransferase n=1 Tax=Thalassospira lucentensis TaxID=168935 RepID=UPI00142DE9D4|nr:GNAT family protein [Thalassospira lucentensis]NIZ00147.1 GNAT family N-acetyltransferase [Thalassospira lucentensis]
MLFRENLVIRQMEHRDIENARLLHNHPSVLKFLTDVRLISEAEQENWFKAVSTSKSARRLVVEEDTGAFVGVFRLDAIDLQNRNAMVGLDITPEKRGLGYATITFEAMFNYLFGAMGLHRLSLVTMVNNTVAVNLYKKLGFVEEGLHKEAIYRDGSFVDLRAFALVKQK